MRDQSVSQSVRLSVSSSKGLELLVFERKCADIIPWPVLQLTGHM